MLLVVSILLLLPHPIFADTSHVVIGQIQVAGPAGSNDEWIELYNPTTTAVDISSYSIQYKTATGTTVSKKNFSTGASIPAHGYYLIAHSSAQPSVTPDMSHSTFSLAASGGNVFLVNNTTILTDFSTTAIVDKVAYGTGNTPEGSAAPAPASGQTIERKPGGANGSGTDTDNNSNDLSINTTPTAHNTQSTAQPALPSSSASESSSSSSSSSTTTESSSSSSTKPNTTSASNATETTPANTTPTTTPTTASTETTSSQTQTASTNTSAVQQPTIVINEVLPNPADGEKEWIELFAPQTGSNLTGWKLEDGAGVIATLDQTMITSFAVVELSSSRLNNDGDTITLKDASGAMVDRMTYGSFDDGNKTDNATLPAKATGLNRFPDGHDTGNDVVDWFSSKQLTKGTANIITTTDPQTTTEVVTRVITPEAPVPMKKILINEFVSDPGDGAQEWVELINMEQNAVDLTDWTLEDGSGGITNLSGRLGAADNDRYLIIFNPKGNLNNSGDAIVLRNEKRQEVDRVHYGSWGTSESQNAPSANDPNGVSRIIDGFRSGNNARDFQVTTTPTPGKTNRVTLPVASPASSIAATNPKTVAPANPILISEVLPNPVGEDADNEWIELWNPSDAPQTLTNGVIELNNGARHLLPLITIATHGFFVLTSKDLPPLPNNGMTVKLLERQKNSTGRMSEKEIDHMAYSAALHEGASIALSKDGEWLWTTNTTVGSPNTIAPPNETPVAVISLPKESVPNTQMLFDASDSFDPNGDALTYSWTFSDGAVAAGRSVEHAFAKTGTAAVVLVVSDGVRSESIRKTIRIATDPAEEAEELIATTVVKTEKTAPPKKTTTNRSTTSNANTVQIQGVVIAPPSAFNDKLMAVAGSDLPIRLTANRRWPAIRVGDVVELEGKTATTTQGTVLRVSNPALVRVTSRVTEPKPEIVSIEEALDRDESDLIQITGTLRDIRAKSWLVENRNTEIIVVPPTPLPRAAFEGDLVTITGIMEHTTSGDRLRARFASDVILPPPPTTDKQPNTVTIPNRNTSTAPLIVFGMMLAVGLAILVVKEPTSITPINPAPTPQTLEPEPMVSSEGTLRFPSPFQEHKVDL